MPFQNDRDEDLVPWLEAEDQQKLDYLNAIFSRIGQDLVDQLTGLVDHGTLEDIMSKTGEMFKDFEGWSEDVEELCREMEVRLAEIMQAYLKNREE